EAPSVDEDPLFANMPGRRAPARVAAEWLAGGARLDDIARALSRAARPTRFVFHRRASLDAVRASIDQGLPMVLGWESRELGNHTVVAVGYDDSARSPRRWLRVLDPIRSVESLEWSQLVGLASPVEAIACAAHQGWRPDRLTVERDRSNTLIKTTIHRWDPT